MQGEYKKRKSKKIYYRIFIFIIITYFFLNSSNAFFSPDSKLVLAEKYLWTDFIEVRGVTIKKEQVSLNSKDWEIKEIAKEGTRLAVGDEIAEVSSLKEKEDLNMKILELNESIESLKKNMENESVQDSKNNDPSLPEAISIDNLEKEKERLLREIKESSFLLNDDVSGIVSYILDGYEDILTADTYEEYTYSKLKKLLEIHESEDILKTKGIKIIDNFTWNIAILVENNSNISPYSKDDKIILNFHQVNAEIQGQIVEINESSQGFVYIIELKDRLHEFYNLRFFYADIIEGRKFFYKIPLKSLYSHNDLPGVLYKDFLGEIRFKPVKIMEEKDDYIIIDKGDEKGYIRLSGLNKDYKTVSLFDEIILNPSKIKPSNIVN